MARHDPGPEPDPAPTPPDGIGPTPEAADVTDTGATSAAAGAPRALMRAFGLWLLVVVLGIAEFAVTYAGAGFTLTDPSSSEQEAGHPEVLTQIAILSVVVPLVWWVVEVLAAFALRRGRGWARVVLSVFGAITVVLNVVQLVGAVPAAMSGEVEDLLEVVLLVLQAAAVIAALVLTYQPASRRYLARSPAS